MGSKPIALLISLLISTVVMGCFSELGRTAGHEIAAALPKLQPLKDIDPDVTGVAKQYDRRWRELNDAIMALNDTIDHGLQAQVTGDVGNNLVNLIHEFNQKVSKINNVTVSAGFDDKTLSQVEGLMMIIERGVKVGLDIDTLAGLDKLRVEMSNQPNKWQGAMSETISTLESSSSNVAKEVAGQLQAVLQVAQSETTQVLSQANLDVQEVVASTGAEGRCNADYLAATIDTYIGNGLLNRIRYSILGQGVPPADLVVSGVCRFIPPRLTLIRNGDKIIASQPGLTAWGYGFSMQNRPHVRIVDGNGAVMEDAEPIGVLITTRYQIEIDLQGVDFSNIGPQDHLELMWPTVLEPNEVLIELPPTPTAIPLPPTPTSTVTPVPEAIVTVLEQANIRSGPSTEFGIIGSAQEGEKFAVIGRSEDAAWWRIALNGEGYGYIAGFLVAAEHADGIPYVPDPVLTPTPVPTPTSSPTPTLPPACQSLSSPNFQASATVVESKQAVTLTWSADSNVEKWLVRNDRGDTSDLGMLTNATVYPESSATYFLIAIYCGGKELTVGQTPIRVDTTFEQAPTSAQAPGMPPIQTKIACKIGLQAQHARTEMDAEQGYKIVGGGAQVLYGGHGALLTASYPESATKWVAVAKDMKEPDPSSINVCVIQLYDPNNQWDVQVFSSESSLGGITQAQVSIPDDYVMTGGGARVNWTGEGNYLTASYPSSLDTWEARSKEHYEPDPATLDVYAIGIKPQNGNPYSRFPETRIFSSSDPSVAQAPERTVEIEPGYTLLGGGAIVNWSGYGNLLTASYPSSTSAWTANSKDQVDESPASLFVYAIGFRQ